MYEQLVKKVSIHIFIPFKNQLGGKVFLEKNNNNFHYNQ